jgi:ribosomal protein L37AE/L43A
MKHITLFEAYSKKTTCEKCDHSWEIEKEDKHPYLCHTCGYDSEEKKFNPKELERFWRNYEMND